MKTIIITGAGGSLGKSVVSRFASENYFVAATVSKNKKGKLPEKKGQMWTPVDLAVGEETEAYVKKVVKTRKRIDVLVTAAGGFAMGNIGQSTDKDIQKQLDLNFYTAYNIVKPVFAQMKQQSSGRIFLIGSKSGLDATGGKDTLGYTFSKSLLFRLAEVLNKEAGLLDIVTTVIVPSVIDTPQNRQDMPDADFARWVKPSRIAEVIHFYCTPAADDIKSPVIKVFGGA